MKKIPSPGKVSARSRTILWIFLTAILAFTIGFRSGRYDLQVSFSGIKTNVHFQNRQPPTDVTVDLAPFWESWDVVLNQYLGRADLDQKKLLYGAISGMVGAVGDPYTSYLTPEENKAIKEELNGTYEGIGVRLGYEDDKEGKIVIIAPLSGSPAQKAGIKPGDEILAIGEESTQGMSLPKAVQLIRGPVSSNITLTLSRGGEDSFDLNLKREKIQVKSVEAEFLEGAKGTVALIKLSRFGDQTESEWDSAVSLVLSKKASGVILDLRSNPGGYLNGANYVASEFIDGKIYGTEDSTGSKEFTDALRDGKLLNIPLVVLIDKGSASASEIVAGAIQVRGRAKLVGENSFGKGSVQNSVDLADNNGGILITIEKWLLPNGEQIKKDGLKPNYEVKAADTIVDTKDDPQVKKALEIL